MHKNSTEHGEHAWYNTSSTPHMTTDKHLNFNHAVQQVVLTPKNTRDAQHFFKVSTIPRHASEEDFRRNSGIINSSGVGNNDVPFSSE